jgi:Rrf2 family iron-sulfur cluster assembly transcriptional regulator
MILTTKGRYAVIAMIEIAEDNSDHPVTLAVIAKKQRISLSYLEQIFAKLRKAGIVKSIKGPGGGYVLAKNKINITIADIVRAIGETVKMTRCDSDKKSCLVINGSSKGDKMTTKCKTHDLWRGLEKRIYAYLGSISLSDICDNSTSLNDVICQNIGSRYEIKQELGCK